MDGKCRMHRLQDRSMQAFDVEKLKERDYLYNREVDGMIILKLIFKEYYRAAELKYLVMDRCRSLALVKAVMNLRAS